MKGPLCNQVEKREGWIPYQALRALSKSPSVPQTKEPDSTLRQEPPPATQLISLQEERISPFHNTSSATLEQLLPLFSGMSAKSVSMITTCSPF